MTVAMQNPVSQSLHSDLKSIIFFSNPNAIFQFSGPQAFQQTGSI